MIVATWTHSPLFRTGRRAIRSVCLQVPARPPLSMMERRSFFPESSASMTRSRGDLSARDVTALLAACRAGDAASWTELVGRYRRLVYGVPRALGLQPADADEVFQHTFSELLRHLGGLRDPSRLDAWLITTARRASIRMRRDERRRAEQARMFMARTRLHEPGPDARIEWVREAERVRRTVETMGEPCRSLVLGMFTEPVRSYRDLAEDLGLAIGTLGSLRARCLTRLRARLAACRRKPVAEKIGGKRP